MADHTCSWTWMCTFDEDEYLRGRSGFAVVLRKGHPIFEIFEQAVDHLPFDVGVIVKRMAWYRELAKKWVGDIAEFPISDLDASNVARPFWAAVHRVIIEDWDAGDEE